MEGDLNYYFTLLIKKSMLNKYYLYRHIRLDKNEPFYIGIGSKPPVIDKHGNFKSEYSRAFSFSKRTKYWKNIVAKTEFEVEIMLESESHEFIKEKEIEFIALYGRKDLGKGILCNLTDGGDGSVGFKHTEETLNYLKENNTMKDRVGALNPASEKVIDTLTLEIYDCAKYAAEANGYNPKIFRRYMTGERKNPTYCVYLKNYTSQVHIPEKLARKNIKVMNTETGEEFPSIRQAAISVGIHSQTLDKQIRERTCCFEYV